MLIPRRPTGAKRVSWAPATYPAIHDFLTNPAYAGAFVSGRTRTEKRLNAGGRLVSRTRQVRRQEWSVLIPDHHPGFVSWERLEAVQDRFGRTGDHREARAAARCARGRPCCRDSCAAVGAGG